MTIQLEGVGLERILHDVSCEIGGGITLLIGQIGAGKSTLLDVMTGLQKPSSGSVSYSGKPLWKGKRVDRDVQNSIGVVFQSPEQQLFAKTVEAEFAYSLQPLRLDKKEVARRTRDALAVMGLPKVMLQQSPLTLSGGQKRRVALGTTLAVEPRWLFLDEPTAGLDPQSTERLVDWCKTWAARHDEGTLVIATHDLDAFFPIADRVLVIANGKLVADARPQELCEQPKLLQQAGIGLPESLKTVLALRANGFDIPFGPLSPDLLADFIVEQGRSMGRMENSICKVVDADPVSLPATSLADKDNPAKPLIYRLDPRAKWVFYVALSIGLLMQSTWLGLLAGTMITLVVLLISQVSYRELWRVTKPFLLFLGFSVLLSGLQFSGGIGFAVDPAVYAFTRVYKVLFVLILGVLLSATTGQLRMKRALEQALAPLARIKVPVEAFALAVSIMLRFIPVILRELQRFSRITRARGRSNAKLGGLGLRDIPVLVIPLLLSVLKLGEELSLAMEARGYGSFGRERTSSIRLRLQKADYWGIGVGLLLLMLLAAF